MLVITKKIRFAQFLLYLMDLLTKLRTDPQLSRPKKLSLIVLTLINPNFSRFTLLNVHLLYSCFGGLMNFGQINIELPIGHQGKSCSFCRMETFIFVQRPGKPQYCRLFVKNYQSSSFPSCFIRNNKLTTLRVLSRQG